MKYKYVVIFLRDNGELYIHSKKFDAHMDAINYADTIAPSRKPVVVPFIPLSPTKGDEFNCGDHDEMALMVRNIKDLLLFGYDEAGSAPKASHLVCKAINDLSNAYHNLKLAALEQTEAVAARTCIK